MTDTSLRWVSGLLFLVFTTIALWWLRREYKQHGRLTWFGSFIHVIIYGVHGMLSGIMVWGINWAPPIGRLAWLGILLIIIGLGIIIYGMDLFRTFSRWLGSGTPGLQTNGLYSYSRNPQFVGYGLLLLGCSITWWNNLAWIGLLTYAALAYAVTLIEEEHLSRAYGDSYRDYCRRVPRYLGLPKRS